MDQSLMHIIYFSDVPKNYKKKLPVDYTCYNVIQGLDATLIM